MARQDVDECGQEGGSSAQGVGDSSEAACCRLLCIYVMRGSLTLAGFQEDLIETEDAAEEGGDGPSWA